MLEFTVRPLVASKLINTYILYNTFTNIQIYILYIDFNTSGMFTFLFLFDKYELPIRSNGTVTLNLQKKKTS